YNAAVGSKVFGDRDFTIVSLPDYLIGAEQLLTACDAKGTTGEAATFISGENINLYTAVDTRVENTPDFLTDWEKLTETMKISNDVELSLYKKIVSAYEKISLGSNGQTYNCINYTVFAQPYTEPDIDSAGDINKDGEVSAADLILLSKHLLNESPLSAEYLADADMNGDGRTDTFDLILLRKALIKALSD
ncbi:MAG: dockerin type I repeat-containing protein, partial [Ruminococcus sp.]|nr:dockerin type I repeat-containing protein [Ruminococcus sp.]